MSVPVPWWRPFDTLPYAHSEPLIRCRLRSQPEDFVVDEILAFGPDGDGEHRMLRVRKTNCNTDWAARRLAALAGVPHKMVGYAGLKDRRAVTTQWFSVHLGARPEPDWSLLATDGIEVLESHAHKRKLRRGVLAGNRFDLLLRDVEGDVDALAARVVAIASLGVPNYYGPQRFGREQNNLHRAAAMFRGAPAADDRGRRADRHLRGLYLSAARSQLFNEVLAARVERGDWHSALPGERLQLRGSHSHFLAETIDERIRERVASGDTQPTGPLFGAGEPLTAGEVARLEAQIAAPFAQWQQGLAAAGLKQERRPLALYPEDLRLSRAAEDQVRLQFSLPVGSYATALLRELAAVWMDG
ncbi:MAG: tRNA pseudouridine(13) synthase TruD [Thiohalocapsa sp.]|uniref:tRNA pseudouridine(13) synthase TruD n=1 Tax=Thiohalocapsa sp. TaxID=2497641 RepID=UPI0025F9FBCE|nr:tRNA pseudouridine(13) synthase TruD [Thiohalocapsa sp.]MCG6941671.1 tRNA pseudouridine(13) synthase TruD [Thiohalocapsa sp.]